MCAFFQHFLESFSQLEHAVDFALQLLSCFGHTAFHRGWFGYVHLQIFLLAPGWNLNQVQPNNFGQMLNVLLILGDDLFCKATCSLLAIYRVLEAIFSAEFQLGRRLHFSAGGYASF